MHIIIGIVIVIVAVRVIDGIVNQILLSRGK